MPYPYRRNGEVLSEYLKPQGQIILDVGCGKGKFLGWLRKRGATAIGLDPQWQLLSGMSVAASGSAIPFADQSFDTVVFFNSLHHVPAGQMEAALNEAARLARSTVLVIEPIAEGSAFLSMQPLDDETQIRSEALKAMQTSNTLRMVSECFWQFEYAEKDLASALQAMITVDPTRRQRIDQVRQELEALFVRHGRVTDKGFAFDQPMRLNLLHPV